MASVLRRPRSARALGVARGRESGGDSRGSGGGGRAAISASRLHEQRLFNKHEGQAVSVQPPACDRAGAESVAKEIVRKQ